MRYDPDKIAGFFKAYGAREWERFDARAQDRVNLHVHTHYLRQYLEPGMHVLDAGAGPGRFTIEMARLGAKVSVIDLSEEMLELNELRLREAGLEEAVVLRDCADITDLGRFGDRTFDAVVCYGGPLSYVMERADDSLTELLRVARPGSPILLSVMSNVGSLRAFLGAAFDLERRFGPALVPAVIENGLLTEEIQGNSHVMKMYRWEELEELLSRHGCSIEVASASNFLTAGRAQTAEELAGDEAAWQALLEWEVRCCKEPGAVDGGTHIIVVARKGR